MVAIVVSWLLNVLATCDGSETKGHRKYAFCTTTTRRWCSCLSSFISLARARARARAHTRTHTHTHTTHTHRGIEDVILESRKLSRREHYGNSTDYKTVGWTMFVCFPNVPATCFRYYARDRSAETVVLAATLKSKLHIRLVVSPSRSMPTWSVSRLELTP